MPDSSVVLKGSKASLSNDCSDVSLHLGEEMARKLETQMLLDGPAMTLAHRPKRKVESIGTHRIRGREIRQSRREPVDQISLKFLFARPWWLTLVQSIKDVEVVQGCQTVKNVHNGIQSLQRAFINEFQQLIEDQLGVEKITIAPAEVNPNVFVNFMERCEEAAKHGVYPRLCFHGTRQANVPSIYQRGLLTPLKLHPEGWYTPAIWTATHAQTSVSYSDAPFMFACAVLDDTGNRIPPPKIAPVDGQLGVTRVRKVEKQHGRRQHRVTRKPVAIPTIKSPKGQRHFNTERLGDGVVLIYNESHVCPLLTIEWENPRRKVKENCKVRTPAPWPRQNPNTASENHAEQTLVQAANASHLLRRKPYTPHRNVALRMVRRMREQKLRVHLDKRSHFFLSDDF